MAHNLNYNSELGRYSFVSVKEPAWHAKGIIVDKAMTTKEAIELAGLDYKVRKGQLIARLCDDNGVVQNDITITNKFATYRADTNDIFGLVTDRYEVVQNTEGFVFFDSIVGEGKAIFETAGVLGNGETIFVTAKLPGHIRINGTDDITDKYLFLTMNHSGEKSIMAAFTPIRVVCNNTLSAALSNAKSIVKIRHTASAKENMNKAMELLNLTNILSENSQKIFNQLAKQAVNDIQMTDYIHSMILNKNEMDLVFINNRRVETVEEISTRKKNVIDDIKLYHQIGIGQKEIHGTAWGLYNSVTGYMQNMKKYTSDDSKLSSMLSGTDNKLNNFALNEAYALVDQ